MTQTNDELFVVSTESAPAAWDLPVTMRRLTRLSLGSIWLYQGLLCKLIAPQRHIRIVASLPGLSDRNAWVLVVGLGLVEAILGLWIFSGRWSGACAAVQTGLLVLMNAGGLIWGRAEIADPGSMITQNLLLVFCAWWLAATEVQHASG